MAYKIRPQADRVYIDEFRQDPTGHHSLSLLRILNALRGGPLAGKYVLVCTKPFQKYTLARHGGDRGKPPVLMPEFTFSSREEAEWAVFRLRWKETTGEDIN